MLNIKIADYKDLFSSLDAFKIHEKMLLAFKKSEKMILDFEGVENVSPTFLNVIIDVSIKKTDYDFFWENVRFIGLCPNIKKMILERKT